MSAPISTPASRTSKQSFIDGEFEIVRYAEFLAKEYPKALATAIEQAAREETLALQEAARQSDTGWMGMIGSLGVNYNENEGTVEYGIANNDELSRSATDLEYGVPGSNAPQPLLRSFLKRREEEFGNTVANKVARTLNGKYR